MKKITGKFPSASGLCDVHFYIYTPEDPKAVIMLSHGKSEYFERYKDFAEFLCQNGIALCGNDHIGHGSSISDENMFGYFGSERGYINMVRDLHRMRHIADDKFPNIPHILMGHSMGSFLARIYFSKYPEDKWNGAIFMGTSGGMAASAQLSKMIDLLIKKHGCDHRHELATSLGFGAFNLRTERRTPNDWLSRDEENVDRFNADPKCSYIFTLAGYRDLVNAMTVCNSKPVIENTPTDVPLLFMSGSMDPIGEYGDGVQKAIDKYVKHGCNVNVHIYHDARHELLFELNRDEVMNDILEFIKGTIII